MHGGNISRAIDEERRRQGIHSAKHLRGFVIAEEHAVIDLQLRKERVDHLPTFIIHGNAEHGETLIFVAALEIHKPGDFDTAWAAPGGPEIEQHDLAPVICQMDHFTVGIFEREIRGRFAITAALDRRATIHTPR